MAPLGPRGRADGKAEFLRKHIFVPQGLTNYNVMMTPRSHCYYSESKDGYPSLHIFEQKFDFWSTVGWIRLGRVIKRNLHAMLLLQIPFLLNVALHEFINI